MGRLVDRIGAVMSVWRLAAVAAAALLAACASTPEAPPARDAEAKAFGAHPNAATIYVYRNYANRSDQDTVLFMDGRIIGATVPGTYFRIDAQPGRHVLHGIGADVGKLTLDARPGELYFVRVDVTGSHANYTLSPAPLAKKDVAACCVLLENWTPGQRPFLR